MARRRGLHSSRFLDGKPAKAGGVSGKFIRNQEVVLNLRTLILSNDTIASKIKPIKSIRRITVQTKAPCPLRAFAVLHRLRSRSACSALRMHFASFFAHRKAGIGYPTDWGEQAKRKPALMARSAGSILRR
jgi:hypothetical protein